MMEPIANIDKIKVKLNIWDVVDYINSIFEEAINLWVSDIHIEPTEDFLMIRFRQDGDFFIVDKLNNENYSSIVTRLKVLSKIKIDENKKPQDGKIVYYYEKEDLNVDIRLSTLPTNYGEKVVMRILKQDESLTNLDALGFIDINLEKIKKSLKSTYWIILVAWPTWSWKSTTLFWILKHFDPLEFNISTLEDPIEYNIQYVNQSQTRSDIWYTFATGLRSLVRQDPDIIMVWEIRDHETAILAVEAALTWHLVLSTIHTNSATWTVQRLINMDVEPFLLASAMKMVISQRLVKRNCKNCKEEEPIKEPILKKVEEILWNIMEKEDIRSIKFVKWKGCDKCNHTWYKWRMWIHEVLIIWEFLEKMILEKDSSNNMKKNAVEHGMITIVQDGLLKAALWETTVEEALKLI